MAAGNVTISLPQMIDLALNVPEHGSVNFNLLQSILHVVVQQLELVQCKVEFRGKDGEKVQNLMTAVKPEATVKITEYVVSPAKDAGKVLNRHTPQKGSPPAEATQGAINIDQVGSQENLQTVVVVEPGTEGAEATYQPCMISKKQIQDLNEEVTMLKTKVLELAELPGNSALIDALRGAGIDKGTPLLDMFQLMTMAKKLEAAEGGVEKLASIVEDLAKQGGMGEAQIPGVSSVGEALGNMQTRLTNIEIFLDSGGEGFKPAPTGSKGNAGGGGSGGGGAGGVGGGGGGGGATGGTSGVRDSIKGTGGEKPGEPAGTGSSIAAGGALDPFLIDLAVPDFSKMSQEEFAAAVHNELRKIKEEIKHIYERMGMFGRLSEEFSPDEIFSAVRNVIKKHRQNITGTGAEAAELPAGDRLERLEDRFNGTDEQIASLDSTINHEINNLHSQFAEMEKAFGNIVEKIHFGMPGGDSAVAGETLGELYDKLMSLQSDMENLAETASKLVEDKEDKQRLLEVITEQVEFLKTVKADKEDLEDALADKADACAINRKVSHDQFDTACDELSRGIEEALAKLTQQEELWQQALNEIQKEIGNKLDRMELGPLRDFVNNKLKMLQQRLKALTALKQETEAAGTKKFLRNVNCISCDKDVVMRKEMDPSLLPQPYALPPSRSMGPYLAYELDALRKQQKSLPNSRNLNHFENALQQKSPRTGEDHICNRYCGGSHTITTPQQRVTRLGHFLNQWGPEAQAVGEGGKGGKEDDPKLAIIGTSNVVHQQESASKASRVDSAEKRESMKQPRKSSIAPEGRKSSIPSERRKSSVPRISVSSPKGSTEVVEKRRSSVSSQKSSSRRGSQSASGAASLQKEPSGLPATQEETPSEVAKENEEGASPPLSPSGSPVPAAAEGDAPTEEAAQPEQPPTSPMSAKASGQISARASLSQKSKTSQQQVAKSSATAVPAPSEEPAPPSPPPAEEPVSEVPLSPTVVEE